jgi:hypothetical protein
MRINWPSNHEDFKLLDNGRSDRHRGPVGPQASIHSVSSLGQSDHHRGPVGPLAYVHSAGSLGGLTVTEVSLTASLCSILHRFINDHKWILLARSMAPARGSRL